MFVILGVPIAFGRGADALHGLHDGSGRRIEAKNVLHKPFEKAPPTIPGEPRITGHSDEPAGGRRCAPDIEHGVKHTRHRYGGSGADRNQERPAAVTKSPACGGFQISDAPAICGMVLAALAPSTSALAEQKSAAACRAEWRANKAANQAAGKTEKAYVAECRSGAAPAKSPVAAPAPRASVPTRQVPAQQAPTRRSAAPTGANEFSTEPEAKAHCPGDTVVWANTKSRIYHFSGNRGYGSTKAGAYMCEKDTAAAGIRAAKNEKHP
jgi:hypothetical protein